MPRMVTLRGPTRELIRVGTLTVPRPRWIIPTLGAGCSLWGPPNEDLAYTKDDLGFVLLRGVILWSSGALPLTVCILPEGYRPKRLVMVAVRAGPSGVAHVTINQNGGVIVDVAPAGAPIGISFDGIRFDVEL